jgi:hypothetical protein
MDASKKIKQNLECAQQIRKYSAANTLSSISSNVRNAHTGIAPHQYLHTQPMNNKSRARRAQQKRRMIHPRGARRPVPFQHTQRNIIITSHLSAAFHLSFRTAAAGARVSPTSESTLLRLAEFPGTRGRFFILIFLEIASAAPINKKHKQHTGVPAA